MRPLLDPIKFGTDGWRAIIAREFTFANVERVAQAYADYLTSNKEGSLIKQLVDVGQISEEEAESQLYKNVINNALPQNAPLVIVGFDRRFLSEHFAKRAAEVLVGNGFRIAVFGEAAPTPLISWTVRDLSAVGGLVITASHNPPDFNGFKIKASWGGSASPDTTAAVERLVDANPPKRAKVSADGHELLEPAVESYRSQVTSYIDIERLRRTPGKVIVDSMHGSGSNWVEGFLTGAALEVETIRSDREPLFGGVNPEPIDRNLEPLKQRVLGTRALVGLASDGDADRVGAVNERGETMTMHDMVPLLLLHLARKRKMTGGVVRTFSQSVLLKRIAAALNLKLYETPIGFKYVAELMLAEDILIGAEESGGIGLKGHIPERDGILNSLLFLEAVIAAGRTPSEMLCELHREFGEFHFGRRDLQIAVQTGLDLVETLTLDPPAAFNGDKGRAAESWDGAKLVLGAKSWFMFRQSGTDPVLRIYSAATSIEKMCGLLNAGEEFARS